jgi:hypothetical protein
LIDSISEGYRIRVLPFLDVVLNAITNDNYIAYLFYKNDVVRSFYSEKSPLCRFYGSMGYDAIREIVISYGFEFESIQLENNMFLLYISEKKFEMPRYTYSDPNILLKQICNYHGYDNHMLQSINGVMAAVNSMYGKEGSVEELYNWSKYKFISDPNYKDIIEDKNFDRYIVNKIMSMKRKRMGK